MSPSVGSATCRRSRRHIVRGSRSCVAAQRRRKGRASVPNRCVLRRNHVAGVGIRRGDQGRAGSEWERRCCVATRRTRAPPRGPHARPCSRARLECGRRRSRVFEPVEELRECRSEHGVCDPSAAGHDRDPAAAASIDSATTVIRRSSQLHLPRELGGQSAASDETLLGREERSTAAPSIQPRRPR